MSEEQKIHMMLEREDVPTQSVRKRWNYWLFIKHAKWTIGFLILFVALFAAGFPFVIYATKMHWGFGFIGFLIMIGYGIYYIFIGLWFILSRAFWAILFAPIIYIIISSFINSDRVGLRELGGLNTHFFKITTTSDGYILHENVFFGLRKKPIYLDERTAQYFKEQGDKRTEKEGKKDESYLEIDIVPLSWRGDSLFITDEETKKKFINNALLVTPDIRDFYSFIVKGFSPTDRESEKVIIYDKILGSSDKDRELIQLKRELKDIDIEHLHKVAEVLIPHDSDELRRFKGILKETTEGYDKISKKIEQKTSMLEKVKQESSKKGITNEELVKLVAIEELD